MFTGGLTHSSNLKSYDETKIMSRYGNFIEHINNLLKERIYEEKRIFITRHDDKSWHKTGVYGVIYDCALRGSEGCSHEYVNNTLGLYFLDKGYKLDIVLDEYMNNWKDNGWYSIEITW